MGPFTEPMIRRITPLLMCSISFLWTPKRAVGKRVRSRMPISAQASMTWLTRKSPFRR